ncbi:MAG: MATE family efflux transporter [Legionellaceae bacterium]|nr:MATE family efflux transporter [Legionellaceae bacterium]
MSQASILYYLKEILKLTTPIVSVRIFYIAVGIIGMLLIAQLGELELAAGALVTALSSTVMVIAMSPLLAISIIVGQYHGEGRTRDIGIVLRQAWLISLFMGLIGSLILWNLDGLLAKLNQPQELIPLIRAYFHGLAWGIVPSFLTASCYQIFFPLRKGKMIVAWSAANLFLVVLLGALLIFGYAGFPQLGISGWAYAVSIVNWIMLVWVLGYLYLHQDFKLFQLFNFERIIDYPHLINFFKISMPITLQFSNEMLAFSALNIMVGWLGAEALSVQQIVIQSSTAVLMVPMGMGQACSILIAHAMGRNETHRVKRICYVSIGLVCICMAAVAIIYLAAPMAIISLYFNDSQKALIHTAITMLAIFSFGQIFDAVRNVVISALRGMRDIWRPMWINFIILWGVALPLAYIMGFYFNQGLAGLNFGFLIAFLSGALMMVLRFQHKTKDYKFSENEKKPIELQATA